MASPVLAIPTGSRLPERIPVVQIWEAVLFSIKAATDPLLKPSRVVTL